MISTTMTHTTSRSNGGRLVAPEGILPLLGTTLEATARGGLCRLVLRQRFHNPHQEPLSVTYSLPVPEDAAVSGFAFTLGDRRIVGEIDRKASARQRFEDAILEGRTAALLDEERSTVFSQEIGNIAPGAELDVEVEIDLRLRWLEEGQWELRVPSTVAPRYLGAEGRVPDANKIIQDIVESATGIRMALSLSVLDPMTGAPLSPSHRIVTSAAGEGTHIAFAEETAPLDRDVVVRWPVAGQQVDAQLTLSDTKSVPGSYFGLLSLVPPMPSASGPTVPRDLVLLLDTSGSMGGMPIAQAKRVASTLVASLTKRDSLEMVQFSWRARRWQKKPVRMDKRGRQDALAWIEKLSASGGTEMLDGILAALEGVNADSQRQVVLVTDGLIGFEQEIVATILNKLPTSSRVHTVGIGSAVNRTLTAGAARAGKGVEVVLGLGEDPEPAAARLDARTKAPVVVDLEIEGPALLRHAPARLPDLFQGAPARIGLELSPAGGKLRIKGRTAEGQWSATVDVAPFGTAQGLPAVAKLYGREFVNDLEANMAAGELGDWDGEVERAGLVFQVATRMTSWVAIDEKVSVDPDAPTRRRNVPQQLPHGMSIEGVGLRSVQPPGAPGLMAESQFEDEITDVTQAPQLCLEAPAMSRRERVETKARLAPMAPPMRGAAPPPPGAPPPAGRPAPRKRSAAALPPPRSAAASLPPPPQRGPSPAPAKPPVTSDIQVEKPHPSPLRRMAEAVKGFFGGKSDDVKEAARAEEAAGLAVPDVCVLSGTIQRLSAELMVVEAMVSQRGLDWEKPEVVELVWDDGTRIRVKVKQGTRSCRMDSGTTLRLVLDLTGVTLPQQPPATIHLDTIPALIAINLSQ